MEDSAAHGLQSVTISWPNFVSDHGSSPMTIAAAPLIEMTSQVRVETLRLLDAAREDWLTWAPAGTSNHMLWHAGHALWVGDALCIESITGQNELPAGWAEKFGMGCVPVATTREWPSREETRRLLMAQWIRMEDLLSALSPDRLNDPRPILDDRSLVSSIVHGLHDEAKHQGEMYLLLKMCRAREAASNTPTK